jgi:phage terminase small subunit
MPDEAPAPTTFDEALAKLEERHQRYVRHYLGNLNKAKAARLAGFSEKTAKEQGYRLFTNVHIRLAIDLGLKAQAMSKEEVLERLAQQARGVTSDIITLRTEWRTQRIRVPLSDVITNLEIEQQTEEEYARIVTLDENDLKRHLNELQRIREQIHRHQAKLTINPKAYQWGETEPESVQVPYVDLAKLEAAGLMHLVKKVTRHGEIEFFDAQHALELLGKHHRLFGERISLENPDGTPIKFMIGVNEEDL